MHMRGQMHGIIPGNMTERMDFMRAEQTDEDLMMAFELLCKKKAPEKITAMEVAKRAGVTRSTFYNHYADMPTLIEQYEDSLLDGAFEILNQYEDWGKNGVLMTRKFFSTLCRYIRSSNYLVWRFRNLTSVRFVEKALNGFHAYVEHLLSRQIKSAAEQQVQSYVHAYALGGMVGILHKWTSENCADTPEAVAYVLTKIYLTGISIMLKEENSSRQQPVGNI